MNEFMRRDFPRYFVGFILISTGLGKMLDRTGFVTVIEAYRLVPPGVAVALGYSLPFIELGTGFFLVIRRYVLPAASLAIGLHVVMVGAVIITLARRIPVDNCGCFGVFFARPLSYTTLIEDLVMLAMSVWTWMNARKKLKAASFQVGGLSDV